ncbi:sensor histidine kinase [Alkaliphilus metalliredigens]|nr:sensor histidine kinase [Alkaliphilus metalliredigens]
MSNDQFSPKKINEILQKTVDTIEDGKSEVFEIAENARKQCHDLQQELKEMKEKASHLIKEVDHLELLERQSRRKLVLVSKEFSKYAEEDIKEAYEKANAIQIHLILKRQEEKDLIKRRSDLEMRLKSAYEGLQRAENLAFKIGIALDFLSGNLQDISHTLEDMQEKQFLGRRIIRVQEEERHRVAREIHDGPAQSLANVVIKAEICEKLMDIDLEKSREEIQNLKKILRDGIKDIRKIIYNLRPMSLDDIGLIPTLKRYVETFEEETQINMILNILSEDPIKDSIKNLSIFRIIQEALNNVRKHARATNINIKIEITQTDIRLHVQDNGIGFDTENIKVPQNYEGGFGLLNMKERVGLLDGKINIKSKINQGTKLMIYISNEVEEGF